MKVGRYEILREIGHGGMATVYEAEDSVLRTRLALKVFRVPSGSNAAELERKFAAEARILAAIRHPNIVRVTDFGHCDDGCPFLAMDLIGKGGTLALRLAQPQPLSPEDVRRLYADLRAALAHCHARGIVHADFKAENVLLDGDGHAVLADFGIARVLDPGTRAGFGIGVSTTLSGNLGTPYALAPECRAGEKATPASDVYAFGVLLFKLLTGVWYEGSPRLFSLLKASAPKAADLVRRMLAHDPKDRPADATRLSENLFSPMPQRRSAWHIVWKWICRLWRWFELLIALMFLMGWGIRVFGSKTSVPKSAEPDRQPPAPASGVTRATGEGLVIDGPVFIKGPGA